MKHTTSVLHDVHHVQTIPPGLAAISNGRDTLPTNEAAVALNRSNQTLRKWSCMGNGPIHPVRINGRLAWKVADLAKLLNEGSV